MPCNCPTRPFSPQARPRQPGPQAPELDDTDCLTPKQQRAIAFKMKEAIDRVFENTLTGGYKIHVPHPGRIFEHAPTRPLLEKKP